MYADQTHARAYGPSGLCNDVTRPFWIVWQSLVPRGKWPCAPKTREIGTADPSPMSVGLAYVRS